MSQILTKYSFTECLGIRTRVTYVQKQLETNINRARLNLYKPCLSDFLSSAYTSPRRHKNILTFLIMSLGIALQRTSYESLDHAHQATLHQEHLLDNITRTSTQQFTSALSQHSLFLYGTKVRNRRLFWRQENLRRHRYFQKRRQTNRFSSHINRIQKKRAWMPAENHSLHSLEREWCVINYSRSIDGERARSRNYNSATHACGGAMSIYRMYLWYEPRVPLWY